ncbi:ankyrin repeat-containing domain protein [Nemania sp. FL0031]|nr:ankyrin repeat-containing domain protein [Nemania sp. FL0031]
MTHRPIREALNSASLREINVEPTSGVEDVPELRLREFSADDVVDYDVDQKDDDALHKINTSTPLAIVKRLLDAGANLGAVNHREYTPLMVATEAGNIEVCRYLFSKRASSADVKATASDLLPLAAHSGSSELIQMMVEAGADVNQTDPRTGATPLYIYLTTESPDFTVVQYLVKTGKADVNLGGNDLKYPIIQACKTCGLQIIGFLLKSGANVNVEDHEGRRPIHVFYYFNCTGIDLLIEYGADLEARDKLGRTVVHYAAALTDEEVIEKLLKLSNIDVDVEDADGWTPLMWACLQRRPWALGYLVNFLVDRGADIWARGKVEDEEWSPMKLAAFYGGCGYWVLESLEPRDKSKPRHSDREDCPEYWDDEFHQSQRGFRWKGAICDGCFCACVGVCWECNREHGPQGFNLCFRCYPHRDILHPGHEQQFERRGRDSDPRVRTT